MCFPIHQKRVFNSLFTTKISLGHAIDPGLWLPRCPRRDPTSTARLRLSSSASTAKLLWALPDVLLKARRRKFPCFRRRRKCPFFRRRRIKCLVGKTTTVRVVRTSPSRLPLTCRCLRRSECLPSIWMIGKASSVHSSDMFIRHLCFEDSLLWYSAIQSWIPGMAVRCEQMQQCEKNLLQ